MARTWLITSRGIARKVKNPNYFTNYHAKDVATEANRECPNCKHLIDNSDVTLDWPGLPAGVKFDPSDVELLEHLAGKIGVENSKPHILIDEFIPMLEEHEGICYTHPENLPGVKKDGSSIHFFHKISNAYSTGQRKRRKINQCTSSKERVRWHKTGKTKPVLENGVQKGWKKIMVLYKSTEKSSKPDRANWKMHQYHLGPEEVEKEGQVVVSKVFYEQSSNQLERGDMDSVNEESDIGLVKVGPITPKTNTPQPPRLKKDSLHEETEHNLLPLLDQEQQLPAVSWVPDSPLAFNLPKNEGETPTWWAGESQTIELDPSNLHETLLCHEVLDSFPPFEDSPLHFNCTKFDCGKNETVGAINNTSCGISDLENILMDTPPDFQFGDLQFSSQESITSWLDRF